MPDFNSRDVESAFDLSQRLGLSFSNLALLTRALTHRSYVNEYELVEDNERLEFLGDAVLDFIAGAWVYNRFPEMPEGDLTKIRSALVRNQQLAKFSRKLELGRALRLGRGEVILGWAQPRQPARFRVRSAGRRPLPRCGTRSRESLCHSHFGGCARNHPQ